MKDQNKNRPGDKKTNAGWIPKSWQLKKIGDLCTFTSGHGFRKQDWSSTGLPIIRIQNLNGNGHFNYFSGVPDKSWIVSSGDMLFSWAGVKGVSFGPQIWKGPKGVLNQHIYKIHPIKDIDSNWFYAALVRLTDEIERKAHGFKSSLLHVHKKDIVGQRIPLPPIGEQVRIAEILSTWDTTIGQTSKLIDAKKMRMKAFAQKLLSGSRRFSGFGRPKGANERYPNDWRVVRIRELFEPVRRKNGCISKRVLTASGRFGLIDQDEFFNRNVAGESLENYYLLKRGEFAYNRSSMNEHAYGAIKRLDRYDRGVLSTLYICFALRDKSCNSDYYKHFFGSTILQRDLRSIVQVGARAHGLLNVSAADFFNLEIPQPSNREQANIAEILTIAENEIAELENKIVLIEDQKRGLMQKLLTGEVRVKV